MQQIAVRAVHLDGVDAEPVGTPCGIDEGVADARKACGIKRERRGLVLLVRHGGGPTVCQPPSDCGINCPPSHGTWLEPLRPAWASCIATAVFECLRTEARIGFSAASVASFHSPRQPGVMRPISSTWVASMQNIAAPESARLLMWVKCQSLASPLSAEYWHIGCGVCGWQAQGRAA